MIRVSIEVQDQLKAMRKEDTRLEAVGDVVKRLILDNRKLLAENNAYRKQMPTEPMPTVLQQPTGISCLMPNPETEKPI